MVVDGQPRDDSRFDGTIVSFDSTTRASLEEAKALVEEQQRLFPGRPLVLMAARCDLYRPLLFDNWSLIRELLICFNVCVFA
jgi:hypothetical protein